MKKRTKNIIIIIFSICLLSGTVYNIIFNSIKFFKFSLNNLFTVVVTIIFAYWLTQNNQRNQCFSNSIVKILESMQDIINNKFIVDNFTADTVDDLNQSIRVVRNKIDVVKAVKTELKIEEEIQYIEKEFNDYKKLIDNHNSDYNYLNKSKKDLSNHKNLMDSKITRTIVKIYSADL